MQFPDFAYSTFDNSPITFESSASDATFSRYTLRIKAPEIEENEQKERLKDAFLAIPSSTVGLIKTKDISVGVASGNELVIGTINKPSYEITSAADYFIRKQKKAVKYKMEVMDIAERTAYFLRKNGIEAEVYIDLFTDPEYSDWIEPKVQIKVSKEQLQNIYNLFDEILNYSYLGISQKTLERISITIDSE